MSSKKRERARQRARNKNRRQQPQQPDRDPLIGYFAQAGLNALCDGDGLVIAGSTALMRDVIQKSPGDSASFQIRPTTFQEILAGMRYGAAYCLDEISYSRFLEPGRQAGMRLGDEDFSEPGPLGLHFVRIQQRVNLPLPSLK